MLGLMSVRKMHVYFALEAFLTVRDVLSPSGSFLKPSFHHNSRVGQGHTWVRQERVPGPITGVGAHGGCTLHTSRLRSQVGAQGPDRGDGREHVTSTRIGA